MPQTEYVLTNLKEEVVVLERLILGFFQVVQLVLEERLREC